VHWPFCLAKCPYCDFNSHVATSLDVGKWHQAYLQELDYFASDLKDKTITSVFFGGGTPSLMPVSLVAGILDKLAPNFVPKVEITLEANPTSVESEKFKAFASAGVNRVSLGIQAFNEKDLKFLGRQHSKDEAVKAILVAKEHFSNFSFDLIYARPQQSLQDWEQELSYALSFNSPHLSLYQLTIEKGTPFYQAYKNKEFVLPDEELAADMYNLTTNIAQTHGFEAYEVSNYAKKNYQSRHNLNYWHYGDYLGIGAGAHSRIAGKAMMMYSGPQKWLDEVLTKGHAIQTSSILTKRQQFEEMLMMGLRLDQGISIKTLEQFMGMHMEEIFSVVKIEFLTSQQLIEISGGYLKASPKGRLLLNSLLGMMLLG
jgi:putative oxygen-independent coproporphyrinogen III oxidase